MSTEIVATDPSYAELIGTIRTLEHSLEVVQEGFADMELAADDRGWALASQHLAEQLTRPGLGNIARNCRVMAVASPLIKRGLQLRIGYVWGQGVAVTSRAGADATQDVNTVLQDWWDDESNQRALTGAQAQEELERALGTDGQVFIASFTNPLTGRVQNRSTPFEEIVDIIKNPEDRDDPWFYLRQYDTTVVRPFRNVAGVMSTRSRPSTVKVLHPALGYWPARRPREIDGIPVAWDTPMLHVPVNRLDGTDWGIPDVFASVPWARAYDDFLTDWARLVKSLSKFAWKLTGDQGAKVRSAVNGLSAAMPAGVPPLGGSNAGQVAGMGPGANLEAIPKSGATIDSESGRPLAAMVAAGLGVPVTTLLADPGTTGARAVAETLEDPTINEMGLRRELWSSVFRTLAGYVVLQAVKAPRGPLRGTVQQVENRQEFEVAGDDVESTVVVDWPDMNELDPLKLVEAVVAADSTGVMPPVETLRLLLLALRVRDVDEVIEAVTDENGEFVDPTIQAAVAAVAARRQPPAAEPPAPAPPAPEK